MNIQRALTAQLDHWRQAPVYFFSHTENNENLITEKFKCTKTTNSIVHAPSQKLIINFARTTNRTLRPEEQTNTISTNVGVIALAELRQTPLKKLGNKSHNRNFPSKILLDHNLHNRSYLSSRGRCGCHVFIFSFQLNKDICDEAENNSIQFFSFLHTSQ